MGILKQAFVVCVGVLVYSRLQRLFEPKLPTNFGGTWHPDFQKVAEVFRHNVESGLEKGAAFSVYYKGKPVIDVWGGYADIDSGRKWEKDTTTCVFSCTKGVAAVVLAKLVDSGALNYSMPVHHYWPEFAQNGKDNITVEMLISHQGGLVYLDEPLSIYDYKNNREKWTSTLAKQKPAWPPGEHFGYHALTFGLYVDELIQRVDKQGRDTATIFKEEIADKFDIDFSMNTPAHESYRAARLVPRTKYQLLLDSFVYTRYLKSIYRIVFEPESLMTRSLKPVAELEATALLNNPKVREVTVSSSSGTGTARGLAKLYGILTNGGSHDGNQLLSRDRLEQLMKPVKYGYDHVFQTGEYTSFGLGTIFRNNPWGELTVGHTGHGGQVSVGDMNNQLGIAYITNHLTINGIGEDPRYVALETALYDVMRQLSDKK
ncbi:hypothetical protein ACF0H5_019783 [Mactra antiquata]